MTGWGKAVLTYPPTWLAAIILGATVWLVLERGEVSVCYHHPGFDTDVHLRATTATYSGVFNGLRTWSDAVRSGDLEVVGPSRLVRGVPTWFLWSPWVEVTRERVSRA